MRNISLKIKTETFMKRSSGAEYCEWDSNLPEALEWLFNKTFTIFTKNQGGGVPDFFQYILVDFSILCLVISNVSLPLKFGSKIYVTSSSRSLLDIICSTLAIPFLRSYFTSTNGTAFIFKFPRSQRNFHNQSLRT